MTTTINLLSVSPDPRFHAELESVTGSFQELHVVLHPAGDHRRGIESARSRRPGLALVEMGADVRPLRAFAEEVAILSPETTVAGVFRPDNLAGDISESSLLIDALRAGVKDFLRRPISVNELSDLIRRLRRTGPSSGGRLGKIISFVSNKGGVGKSTLAVNTACGLARRHPHRVLLVDASLQMGVCASLLNLVPAASLADVAREADRLDETLVRQLATVHASGLHLLPAPASAMQGVEIDDEILARILTLARRTYDFVLVDTFPMLDRAVISVLDLSDRAYVVMENVVPTLLGGVKFLEVLEGLGVSTQRQRVVLNRYTRLPGSVTAADVTARFGHRVDHVVHFDKRFVIAANIGEPYVLRANRLFGRGRQLQRLVREVEAMAAEEAVDMADSPLPSPADSHPDAQRGPLPRGEVV